MTSDKNIYIIKVMLKNRKTIYRTLVVPGNYSLYSLARAITDSFGFYFDHCFGFYDNLGRKYFDSKECYELFKDIGEESECDSVRKTKVKEVFNEKGKKMLFLFDYGDNWNFIIEIIDIKPAKNIPKKAIVIESKGKAPEQY